MEALLISDFNLANLAGYLKADPAQPVICPVVAPFGQTMETLLDPRSQLWVPDLGLAIVWTRPEGVIDRFRDLLDGITIDINELERQVDAFSAAIRGASQRVKVVFVPLWTLPSQHQGSGLQAFAGEHGVSRCLMRMNDRLIRNLDGHSNIIPLDTQRWLQISGEASHNPRLWYSGKIPFCNQVFKNAAREIKSALRGIAGQSRKLIIVDLDDTLWGGIVGDVGWENLTLGGHDPEGEAFCDFQRHLKSLSRRGTVLGIVSKNDEATALNAIEMHSEMVLRKSDFAGWRINWSDKAGNIVELARQLNLGLESVVFIDDNLVERSRVRDALPQVFVPEWPKDPRFYPQALLTLDCFDKPVLTDEDRDRPRMYVAEREREELRAVAISLDDWFQTLEMKVTVEPLQPSNLARATQLLNKTNQMNLSTRRLSEAEFLAWASGAHHHSWTFRVSDRFGDSGLTGILSVEQNGQQAEILDLVLSCRVMGRKVEETMVHVAAAWARGAGLKELVARYKETAKNKPCLDFLNNSGLECVAESTFRWHLATEYPLPAHIQLRKHREKVREQDRVPAVSATTTV
jgi:FkbH-like protein